jgi:hypothetical protein
MRSLFLSLTAILSILFAASSAEADNRHHHKQQHHKHHNHHNHKIYHYGALWPFWYRPVNYRRPVVVNQYYSQPAYYSSGYQNDQYCREYTEMVRVGGRLQPSYGTACYQPDGSWQVTY